MAKTTFESVDDYISAQPEAARRVLSRVRAILKKALPGTVETISYQIPTFKLDGAAVVYFSGWKSHLSLYPATDAMLETLGEAAKKHKASKGTLRFSYEEPIPAKLIERIAKLRLNEIAERARTKAAKAKATTVSKPKPSEKPTAKAKPTTKAERTAKGRPTRRKPAPGRRVSTRS